jgi:hypothetical protein
MFNRSITSNPLIINRIWPKSKSKPGKVKMESRQNGEKYYPPTKKICIFFHRRLKERLFDRPSLSFKIKIC